MSLKNLIIGGDVNCAVDKKDRVSHIVDKSSDALISFMKRFKLVDIWRELHHDETAYTYIDPSGNGRNSRIDVLLINHTHTNTVKYCNITYAPAPDHKSVVMQVAITNKKRGKGYWKLNNSVLSDEEYVNGITQLFHDIYTTYNENVSKTLLWEYMKKQLKEYSISYCTVKARVSKNLINELENRLNELDSTADINTLERQNVKQELDVLYAKKAKGYQVRSRAKWVDEGEKSSSYFLGLEKKRQSNNCISFLKDENGMIKEQDVDIVKIAQVFFGKLYSSSHICDERITVYLNNISDNHRVELSVENSDRCEGSITLEECTEVVTLLKKNKSPGLDGLSNEFYQKFWHIIGPLLVDVYNESFLMCKLPQTLRESVLSLIHKKDDESNISNYRPISLTSTDYKILAFALSARLHKVIGTIVSSDQSAYIKERFMGTNIRLLNDIIDFYERTDKPGLLFFIDFQKAFDSLEWNFLFHTLKHLGFGKDFITWIQTLYSTPIAYIKNNGYISDQIDIKRGVKQGCPISSLLFIMCVEVLAIKI